MLKIPNIHAYDMYNNSNAFTLVGETVGSDVGFAVGTGVGSAEGLFVGFFRILFE